MDISSPDVPAVADSHANPLQPLATAQFSLSSKLPQGALTVRCTGAPCTALTQCSATATWLQCPICFETTLPTVCGHPLTGTAIGHPLTGMADGRVSAHISMHFPVEPDIVNTPSFGLHDPASPNFSACSSFMNSFDIPHISPRVRSLLHCLHIPYAPTGPKEWAGQSSGGEAMVRLRC